MRERAGHGWRAARQAPARSDYSSERVAAADFVDYGARSWERSIAQSIATAENSRYLPTQAWFSPIRVATRANCARNAHSPLTARLNSMSINDYVVRAFAVLGMLLLVPLPSSAGARVGPRLSTVRIPFSANEGQTDSAVAFFAQTLAG